MAQRPCRQPCVEEDILAIKDHVIMSQTNGCINFVLSTPVFNSLLLQPPPLFSYAFEPACFTLFAQQTPVTTSLQIMSSFKQSDLTGQIFEDLEFVRVLGAGSFGTVYLAKHTVSGVSYAVKCMPCLEEGSNDELAQQAELATHQKASGLPNVISFVRSFRTEEHLFIVLEYAPGGTLFSAIVDEQRFRGEPERVKRAMNQLLDAVECLHDDGVYHRDLKPENILVDEDGFTLHIADFGLATEREVTRSACGTRPYMTPEMHDCMREYHSAEDSDRWALAIIFVNLISGRSPWAKAVSSDDSFAAFQTSDDHFQRSLGLTAATNALLRRCFDEDPSERPSLAEMRDEINAIDVFSEFSDKPHTMAFASSPDACVMEVSEWALAVGSHVDDDDSSREATPELVADDDSSSEDESSVVLPALVCPPMVRAKPLIYMTDDEIDDEFGGYLAEVLERLSNASVSSKHDDSLVRPNVNKVRKLWRHSLRRRQLPRVPVRVWM
ncbi:Beta-glucan synthesis-associated [Mycena chlorophos]|uniref:Beta-glucan synthesis-associated n=1 Tax=Mycena chlorophos TaxID=658473 RepID=A0A8H6S253_MYCCL|nr:Beta-glucan synthesis-associated [Mycena chlorophos]